MNEFGFHLKTESLQSHFFFLYLEVIQNYHATSSYFSFRAQCEHHVALIWRFTVL